MEEADDLGKFSGAAKLGKYTYDPQSLLVDCVEGLRQVDEDCVEVHLLFNAFLLDLSHSEDHIISTAISSEFGKRSYLYVKKSFKTQHGRFLIDPAILAAIGHAS